MIDNFHDLSTKKQIRVLLGISDAKELQEVFQLPSNDQSTLSKAVFKWFEIRFTDLYQGSYRNRSSIYLLRKFKLLLDEDSSDFISRNHLTFDPIPAPKKPLHLNSLAFPEEEWQYLHWLIEQSNVKPEYVDCVNAVFETFSFQVIGFELAEAVILVFSYVEKVEDLEPLKAQLLAKSPENRKQFLLKLKHICDSSNHSSQKGKDVLGSFLRLLPEQQENTLTQLSDQIRSVPTWYRENLLKAFAIFHDKDPSDLIEYLFKLFKNKENYGQEKLIEIFKTLPIQTRFQMIELVVPLSKKGTESESVCNILNTISPFSPDLLPIVTGKVIKLYSTGISGYDVRCYTGKLESEHLLEILAFFDHYSTLFETRSYQEVVSFLKITTKLTREQVIQIKEKLVPHQQEIKSSIQLFGTIGALPLFSSKDQQELVPLLISLIDLKHNGDFLTSLKAFPQGMRKEILIRSLPYLSQMTTDSQKREYILSIGLSHRRGESSANHPVSISGIVGPLPAPLVTLDRLKQGDYSISLINFIAHYLGGDNNPIAISAATQWIQHFAQHVFPSPVVFFREITANAFDSQLAWEQQIGNFGVGFYSIFNLFFQSENPIECIEIHTCYRNEKGISEAYRITFTKDLEGQLQVKWALLEQTTSGTRIRIFPQAGSSFSPAFLKSLEATLEDFHYFNQGYVIVNNDKQIGDSFSKVSVDVILQPDWICVTDHGCGIPLSKINLLLIPSISDKRRPVKSETAALATPSATLYRSEKITSSVIFTMNSVINSRFPLNRKFSKFNSIYDLNIELPKGFKPTLSRNGIVIPGRDSPQAKAMCRMIEEIVTDAFTQIDNLSPRLLMLYFGLRQWEEKGLQEELKGFFSGYFHMILRNELSTRPDCIPCHDDPWIIHFKNRLFGDKAGHYVGLPKELVAEGYTGFELALIKQYQKQFKDNYAPEVSILRKAGNRQMIEGLSVIFLDDELLRITTGEILVTCSLFSGILLAPKSLLDNHATFNDIQRKICQRFADPGKRIQAAGRAPSSHLFFSSIFIPGMKRRCLRPCYAWHETSFFRDYLRNVEHQLKSPFIQSLDADECKYYFLKYHALLPKFMINTCWEIDKKSPSPRTVSYRVFWETANEKTAFGLHLKNELKMPWDSWFREVVILDPVNHEAYRIKPENNIEDLCLEMANLHHVNDGNENKTNIIELLLQKFPNHFEKLPQDELFKRLCVLLLNLWGLDPYQESDLDCFENNIKKKIDLKVFEEGLKHEITNRAETIHSPNSILYGGGDFHSEPVELSQKIEPFAPVLSNLETILKPKQTRQIVKNFVNLRLIEAGSPAHCSSYFGQLFELYYQYLTISPNEFSYQYGSKQTLSVEIHDESFCHIHEAVQMLRMIPIELSTKFLQGVVGKFAADLSLQNRSQQLKKNSLKIPLITDFNTLTLITLLYDNQDTNLPLINIILSLGDSNEEVAALAAIIFFSHQSHPAFFSTPLEYQRESLSLILNTVIRQEDKSKINEWLNPAWPHRIVYEDDRSDLPAAIAVGIDCIDLFTERYQSLSQVDPILFQNPETLFNQNDTSIFDFKLLLETLFSHNSVADVFAGNDVGRLINLIQQTPMTGRFQDFGMITHSAALSNGFNAWQRPLIEIIKNSLDASRKIPEETSIDLNVNYASLPFDAEHSQFVYEVTDYAGFENLEALVSLLIPGYHPTDTNQFGLGFFRMLPDISFIHYQTRLRSDPNQVISMIVQPIRDQRDEIIDLKIGIQTHDSTESIQGTICRAYLKKQTNIQSLIRMKQARHFIHSVLKRIILDKQKARMGLSFINGVSIAMMSHEKIISATNFDPQSPALLGFIGNGYSNSKSFWSIDGLPQHIPLSDFLSDQGFAHPSFGSRFTGEGCISIPGECFVPLQDASHKVLKPEVVPSARKFVLDWQYLHLLGNNNESYARRYLNHFKDECENIEQLIFAIDRQMGSPERIMEKLVKSGDYHWFFNHYSLSGKIEVNGILQLIRVPSFSEYLNQVYQEVYPQWIEQKQQKIEVSFNLLNKWIANKTTDFDSVAEKTSFSALNKSLLELVKKWYQIKFRNFEHSRIPGKDRNVVNKPIEKSSELQRAVATNPNWFQAKELLEQVFTFYAVQVLSAHQIQNPAITVTLCTKGNFSGQFDHSGKNILINLISHPLSQMLSLLESMERKEIDSHYHGDLLHSAIPWKAGVLNHEIYHALEHFREEVHAGHCHHNGVNFEARAREMAAAARQKMVLTDLEKVIHECLKQKDWSAYTLRGLAEEAKKLEEKERDVFSLVVNKQPQAT